MEMKNMRSISICILLQKFYQNIFNSQRNVIFTCKTFFVPPKIYAFNFSGGKVLLSLAKRSPWETLHLCSSKKLNSCEKLCICWQDFCFPSGHFEFAYGSFAFLRKSAFYCKTLCISLRNFRYLSTIGLNFCHCLIVPFSTVGLITEFTIQICVHTKCEANIHIAL